MKIRQIIATSLLIVTNMLHAQVVINIDASQRGPMISPIHYGIFYEDINHAADGGLYAELIRNRSFEDDAAEMTSHKGQKPCITGWSGIGDAQLALVGDRLLNEVQHNALSVTINHDGDGVRNEGFWGINAVEGRIYRLSFWAKSDNDYKGDLTARLQTADGQILGETNIKVSLSKEWKKYSATIIANGNDPKAEFALTADRTGEFQLDMVSLFPPTFKDRENGMRPDLTRMLADMNPTFMRFPGGCFVEGQLSPDNAFRWKRTIGPIEQREGHQNVNWGYRTSDGIGYHEYLQVDVDGDSIRCYLDGNLDLSCATLKGSAYEGVYVSSTIDDAAKIMYVKVVNLGNGFADGVVNLSNCSVDTSKEDALQLIRLSAESGGAENTIAEPHNVSPVSGYIKAGKSDDVLFEVPAYSVSILKIKIK